MNILVFQHAAVEHPGSFRPVLASRGHCLYPVELDEAGTIPALGDFDALLVMGGPMDVWEEDKHPWLIAEKAAIREWVAAGRPFLGICLGEQLLAAAMGGEVAPMTAPPEVGISVVALEDDPIFAGLPDVCLCFQWHGAEVTRLPPGARLLASSPGCEVQAFGIGRHAWGLQFHLELTATTAAEWGALPAYAAALEAVKGAQAMAALETEVSRNLPVLQRSADAVMSNFLDIAEALIAQRSAA